MVYYVSMKCNKCNLILKAKNYVKLARLLEVHNKIHEEEQGEEEREEK
jgi:hypothetical protein